MELSISPDLFNGELEVGGSAANSLLCDLEVFFLSLWLGGRQYL